MIMAEDVCKVVAFAGRLGGATFSFEALYTLARALERINVGFFLNCSECVGNL